MTEFDRFELRLPALLDDLAIAQMPEYADDLLARTAATRQRPGWTFLERWIPMSALTQRFAASPRLAWRLGVALALLVAAAIIGVIAAGTFAPHRPAPFGPASNGQIVFLDGSGRILAGDPVTGKSTVIVKAPGNSRVTYSLDGSRLAFLRKGNAGEFDLMISDADGSHERRITSTPIAAPKFMAWSPRSDGIVMTDSAGTLLLFDATKAAEPTSLSQKLGVGPVAIGYDGFQDRTLNAFRPPSGDQLLFVTHDGGARLQTARLDGSGVQTLLDPKTSGLGYSNLKGAQWSPDGSRIVVQVEFPLQSERWHLYVLDADGRNVHPLGSLSTDPLVDEGIATWSPNGTRIGFQYWTNHADGAGQDFHPVAVVDVASGHYRDVGRTSPNGMVSWEWSPDGLSILQVPGDGSGEVLIINVDTGKMTTAPWTVAEPINWQRTLP